eukprot:symbB.v1.2.010234.t1/scaffold667.1/size175007/17
MRASDRALKILVTIRKSLKGTKNWGYDNENYRQMIVIEVLRAARYPAWLEVKWTLTEAEPQLTSPVPSGAEEVEAIVSGQASLSCSSAREAEVLVEQLSNSLSGMAGASPCPRLSDQGRGTPSREDVLRSPSPSAPLERRVAPQLKAFGLECLGGLPTGPQETGILSGFEYI